MSFGLCVSPGNIPTADELAELRPAFLRSILYRLSDLDSLIATGLPLFVTLNNECQEVGWDWSGWVETISAIAARPAARVIGIGCGNELDLFWSRDRSDVPPEFATGLVKMAAPILRPAGIQVVPTSLAGPDWQAYLERLVEQCGDDVDLYDLHSYGQRPDGWGTPGWMWGDLRPTLSRARMIAGKPVMMSEYGVKVGDAGGELQVAAFLTAAVSTVEQLGAGVCPQAAWFAYTDAIGAPDERGAAAFGLVADSGRRRLAWDAFAAQASTTVIDDVATTPDPPLPRQEPVPMHSDDPAPTVPSTSQPVLSARDAAWRDLWQSATAPPAPVPFNPDAAFYRYWQANRDTAGLPVGPEHSDVDGVFQAFSRAGVLKWAPDSDVTAA